MLTLTERVTRYSIGVTMPEGYSAEAMVGGLLDGLDRIPAHLLRSVTFDQGSEWAQWPVIAAGNSSETLSKKKNSATRNAGGPRT